MVKEVNNIKYNITKIKLNEQKNAIVISGDNTEEFVNICNNNNLKKYKIDSTNICYGILNRENDVYISQNNY